MKLSRHLYDFSARRFAPLPTGAESTVAVPQLSFPMQGFAVSVGWANCVAVEDALGCEMKVLHGQAWITVAGSLDDFIVNPTGSMLLTPGIRYNISALHDEATVLITSPRDARDVDFSFGTRRDGPILCVSTPARSLLSTPAQVVAAIGAAARRWFPAPATSS